MSLFCNHTDFWLVTCLAVFADCRTRKALGSGCISDKSKWRNIDERLKATGAAGGVIEHKTYESLTVMDFVCGDQRESLRQCEAKDFNVFVGFRGGGTFANVPGQIDLHPFAQKTRAGEVLCQQGPAFGAISGLLDQFAFRGGQGGFVGFDAAGWEFDQSAAGGVSILPLEDDVGVAGVLGLVDSQDDDRTVVADDIPGVDVTPRLFNLVGDDREDSAFESEFGRDQARFGRGFLFFGRFGGAGRLYLGSHKPKVSSCI